MFDCKQPGSTRIPTDDELCLTFGKHKGRHLYQVDDAYLQWMLKNFPDSSPWQKAAAGTLAARRNLRQRERSLEKVICTVPALLTDLKSCSVRKDLKRGRRIHTAAVTSGNDSNVYVLTALVKMYAKCGSMVDARRVFDSVKEPDVVSWTALILGYAENGEGQTALDLFSRMKASGFAPDSVTYVAALKSCTSLAVNGGASMEDSLERGRKIHLEIGSHLNHYVQNTLIDMYSKLGRMAEAQCVFDSIQKPDVVSWNALLLGYAENGNGQVGLQLFSRMKAAGFEPNSVTYVAALKACTSQAVSGHSSREGCLKRGREIHTEIGRHLNLYVQNTLIDMYSKCRSMCDARRVFETIGYQGVVSWNALVLGYVENGDGLCAFELFLRMKAGGCVPNSVTYVAALKACTSLAVNGDASLQDCLERGRKIHSEIGCHLTNPVRTSLMDMYAKCRSMPEARRVFDCIQSPGVASWNALLLGYVENGQGQIALDLFSRMKASGCAPDSVTYVAALKSVASLAASGDGSRKGYLEQGRNIHLEVGCELDKYVRTTLIDMYANCGSMVDARRVFDSIQLPDVVSWNALLLGYAENGDGHVVLDLFTKMKAGACVPDSVTYIAALKGCTLVGALALGRRLHSEIGVFTSHLVTCLVDFYAKCGSMVEAQEVFDSHPRSRDVSTWTALLAGYSSFGDAASAFKLFESMQDKGFRPNAVTFVCMLLCCGHAGLVERARECFEAMPVKFGITPTLMHYNCMVDILGRANRLNEAIAMLQKMPCNPDAVTWTTLLGACCKWKNVEIGRLAFQSLVDLNKKDASAYLLMAQIYASKGMWDERESMLNSRFRS